MSDTSSRTSFGFRGFLYIQGRALTWIQMNHRYATQRKSVSPVCHQDCANPSNPAFKVTFPPKFSKYYESKPNTIKFFGLRIAPPLDAPNININNIQNSVFLIIPSLCITKPTILFKSHFLFTSHKTK